MAKDLTKRHALMIQALQKRLAALRVAERRRLSKLRNQRISTEGPQAAGARPPCCEEEDESAATKSVQIRRT